MTLWRCLGCTTLFAESLELCPHCLSAAKVENGSDQLIELGDLTKRELTELAKVLRLTLPSGAKKSEILEIVQRVGGY